jgi:hypothetical protein
MFALFGCRHFTSLRFIDQQITYAPTIEVGAKGDRNERRLFQ